MRSYSCDLNTAAMLLILLFAQYSIFNYQLNLFTRISIIPNIKYKRLD